MVDVSGRESVPGKSRVWQGWGELVLPQDSGSCLPQGRCLYTLGDLRTPFENLIVDLFFQKRISHNVYKRSHPSTPPGVDCLRAPACSLVPVPREFGWPVGGCTVRWPCLQGKSFSVPVPSKGARTLACCSGGDSAREELA